MRLRWANLRSKLRTEVELIANFGEHKLSHSMRRRSLDSEMVFMDGITYRACVSALQVLIWRWQRIQVLRL